MFNIGVADFAKDEGNAICELLVVTGLNDMHGRAFHWTALGTGWADLRRVD